MTKSFAAVFIIAGAGILATSAAAAAQVPAPDRPLAQNSDQVVLPRYLTAAERGDILKNDTPGNPYLWECYPDIAGFTDPPPSTSRFPSEYEQTGGVLYGWPSYGCLMPELTELIRNSIQQVPTTVMVPLGVYGSATSCLRGRGFTDSDLAQINWYFVDTSIPSTQGANEFAIWIRDYGPEILEAEDGSPQFIDMGYYSGAAGSCVGPFPGRPNSDVSPTRFGGDPMGFPADVFRPQLRTEGGNLQTDGNGTCVHMQRDVLLENNFSRWAYTQAQLDAVYMQYFNCSNVITLESLVNDPAGYTVIDHVDMFMTFISATKVLMGQIDPADDPNNAAVLDRNAQRLQDAGYTVVRIPMPSRYCTALTPSCIANPGASQVCTGDHSRQDRVWATYANSIRVGNAMMVPVYHDVPDSLQDIISAQEQTALATFQQELDTEFGQGTVQVVPIVSDAMIPCQGSVHCITMTYK
jgi:agmatine/peptidylarginine deiminase